MSRLALAVAFFVQTLCAFAQPAPTPSSDSGPGAFPTEQAVESFVGTYVQNYCRSQAASCAEAKAIQGGYLKNLADVEKCRSAQCPVTELLRIAGDAVKLDAREEALPFYPALGHPLLRLSVMISARLGAEFEAGSARDRRKYTVAQTDSFSATGMSLAIEKACMDTPAACDTLHASDAEALNASAPIEACAASACSFGQTEKLLLGVGDAMDHYLQSGADVLALFALLNDEMRTAVGQLQKIVHRQLSDLEAGSDSFSRTLDGMEKGAAADPQTLRADSDALFSQYREASIGEDRINYYLGYDKKIGSAASAGRAKINAAAARLAGLRARALALMSARGLSLPDDDAAVAVSAPAPAQRNSPTARAVDALAMTAGIAAPAGAPASLQPTLLNARTVPEPALVGAAPPPTPAIIPGAVSATTLLQRLESTDPTQKADAERRMGLTRTYGQPGLYAAQAFEQERPDSCGVASQVEVLRAHGLLPTNVNPNTQEEQLVAEAQKEGFMSDGTPAAYDGELLIEHGLLVSKSAHATLADLEDVLRRGDIAQVGVDARFLWSGMDMSKPLGHAILVTGMEVNRVTGTVLGFYVDDTGSEVPGAGRFEPLDTMRRAFRGDIAEIR